MGSFSSRYAHIKLITRQSSLLLQVLTIIFVALLQKWYNLYSDHPEATIINNEDKILLDDLNTPGFIAKIHELYNSAIKGDNEQKLKFNNACRLLGLFGLNKKLGPILEWELELESKKISVNTEDFQTNRDGIFAVGDINDYPGKLDLILCGFHETTLAVQKAYQRIFPGERVPFGYTTSNTKLQRKLGVVE